MALSLPVGALCLGDLKFANRNGAGPVRTQRSSCSAPTGGHRAGFAGPAMTCLAHGRPQLAGFGRPPFSSELKWSRYVWLRPKAALGQRGLLARPTAPGGGGNVVLPRDRTATDATVG